MTLLDFARGPALQAALVIFIIGAVWRFVGALLLPWRLGASCRRNRARERPRRPRHGSRAWP